MHAHTRKSGNKFDWWEITLYSRRIKTWLRSQMSQERFNHVSILNTHKERLDNLHLEEVANDFASLNENRQNNFGKFFAVDFQ